MKFIFVGLYISMYSKFLPAVPGTIEFLRVFPNTVKPDSTKDQ